MKKFNPIIIVAGEPNSVFLEIFFKSIKLKKYKSPLILICSLNLLKLQMNELKFKKKIKLLNFDNLEKYKLDNDSINIINVDFNQSEAFAKITNKSKKYIKDSFDIAFKIIRKGMTKKLINGPISKKNFLNKKFLGITEYLAKQFSLEKCAMLIYNKNLDVCPVTTYLPLKLVSKKINKLMLYDKILLINDFYKKNFKFIPKIAVLGLNPHCESVDNFNEDEKILKPAIERMTKKGFKVMGPYPADTIFLNNNRKKFDVIVGMYHDQVLTPLKTLYEYDAINITLGLPFVRVSPDHGPNLQMLGKGSSNPLSLIKAITFLDKN